MTVKDIKRKLRSMKIDEKISFENYGIIAKRSWGYDYRPFPEDDDTNLMIDYCEWVSGMREKDVINDLRILKIVTD